MTIGAVAVDEPVLASTVNQLIQHANGTPGRAIFTANGVWSVPQGVHKFKVYLAGGGGGKGGDAYSGGESAITYPGGLGGCGPLVSKIFSGIAIGTSYSISIGAHGADAVAYENGTAGGNSTFGALLFSNGGGGGPVGNFLGGDAGEGAPGAHNGEMIHSNELFKPVAGSYKIPGYGGSGKNGICVIEW